MTFHSKWLRNHPQRAHWPHWPLGSPWVPLGPLGPWTPWGGWGGGFGGWGGVPRLVGTTKWRLESLVEERILPERISRSAGLRGAYMNRPKWKSENDAKFNAIQGGAKNQEKRSRGPSGVVLERRWAAGSAPGGVRRDLVLRAGHLFDPKWCPKGPIRHPCKSEGTPKIDLSTYVRPRCLQV